MSTPGPAGGRKRLVHTLDTPFSTVAWPEISLEDQEIILELLCNLLSPIGQHRRAHVKPSKGKRAVKRKALATEAKSPASEATGPRLAKPEIFHHVVLGFNAITKELESSSRVDGGNEATDGSEQPYSMVFVARGNQSAAFNCHFPRMVGVASRKGGSAESIRLIGLSKPCSDQLAACLGIARVSSLAVRRKAPGADALCTFVNDHVAPVDVAWQKNLGNIQYQPTQIIAKETVVGTKRTKSFKAE